MTQGTESEMVARECTLIYNDGSFFVLLKNAIEANKTKLNKLQ